MKIPTFYPNKDDDNHCLQAAVMMALDYAGKNPKWEEVETLTDYDPRYWTWTIAGARALAQKIDGVVLYSDLDHEAFAEKGEQYYQEYAYPDWFIAQKEHSSPGFKKEQKLAKAFTKKGSQKFEMPDVEELDTLLKSHVAIALVDMSIIEEGKSRGHYLFVFDFDNDTYHYHDPGLPPEENVRIEKKLLIDALGSIIAIPRKK